MSAPATDDTVRDGQLMVDANVLVFASLPRNINHAAAVAALLAAEAEGDDLCVSPQVVRELLVQLTRRDTRRPDKNLAPEPAAALVRTLLSRLTLLPETAAVTDRLLNLVAAHDVNGKPVHDANIVATMLAHGVDRLLTHNVKDFTRYADAGLIRVEAL